MRIQAKCQQRLGFNTIFLSSVHCIEAWHLQHLSCISFVHMYQHSSGKLYAHSSHISTTFRFHLSVSFSCPWQPLYTTFKLHLFTHIEVTSVLHRIAVYLGDIELNQILAHTQFRHNQNYCNINRIESNCIAHNFAVIKIIMSPIYDNDFFFSNIMYSTIMWKRICYLWSSAISSSSFFFHWIDLPYFLRPIA